MSRFGHLTEEEVDSILGDLLNCLRNGRLVDFSIGYQVTGKGNFKPNTYADSEMEGYVTAGPPQWNSLQALGWSTPDWNDW